MTVTADHIREKLTKDLGAVHVVRLGLLKNVQLVYYALII